MTGFTVEFWLILQLLIEVGLFVLIVRSIYGAKNLRKETMLEKERMKAAVDSLLQLIQKSEALDRKRQKVLDLWGKIEGKGAVLENCIDRYKEEIEEMDSSSNAYEQVSRLIEKGLSAGDISRKLGLQQGEIELVMNLKRQ